MVERKARGWCNGRDPEEFGWVFADTLISLSAYDIGECINREACLAIGVPEDILHDFIFTPSWEDQSYGSALTDYLQTEYNG